MSKKKSQDVDGLSAYRKVYPNLTDEELAEVKETLREYIEIVARIVVDRERKAGRPVPAIFPEEDD